MAARGRPTALETRLTEPGDVNGFHIFPYSLEHGLVPVQALRKQRNKPPSALPREGGSRSPPRPAGHTGLLGRVPALPHRCAGQQPSSRGQELEAPGPVQERCWGCRSPAVPTVPTAPGR